ncbi:MAG: FAD-linked oxidase C-terminal domain-containing protein [Methylococcales bacterium]
MVEKKRLVGLFGKFLTPDSILIDEEDLRPYECDGLTAYRKVPWMVVLPERIEQVQEVMKICSRFRIPVVARGAGTGLSGGALPVDNAVLLGLSKFNRILEIDPLNRIARVEPGVRNLAISQAAATHALYYAPDPSSQIACTIGGNVAENSGGVHCLKYGLTVHNIRELRIVTVEGELLGLGTSGLDAPGYDLMALLTGSEGMLGIIVEITVKLLPIPETAEVLMAAFSSVQQAGDAVAAIIAAGIVPAGLEMMDNRAIRACEAFVKVGYPVEAAALLLCESDGSRDQVAEEIEKMRAILNQHGAAEIRAARDARERQQLWAGRKAAFPAVGRIAPDYYCMDGTIPRVRLSEVLEGITKLAKQHGLGVANVFHAGDGNLHPLILYDANHPGELERAERFGSDILDLCVAVGGTITGEHGVGVEKLNQMCFQFKDAELAQFHAVKNAFDEQGLLNPGKAVPTLKRCAEFGAMHVHRGQLAFPELERF